jgi:glycine dehydrogenase
MEYGHFKEESFSKRHIGLNEEDKRNILKKLGYETMDKFINDVVPQNIKRSAPMKIEKELSEKQLLSKIKEYASLNKTMISMIGQGFYSTHTPSVLLRNILENPSWYTAYTPYQPEISQGRLEALLNFQTMISEITSLPIANASMLDESTAAAEAMTMSFKLSNNKNTVILDKYLHPQTINVIKTRAEPLGINLIISENPEKEKLDDCSCVIFQYPNTEGRIKNLDDDIKIIQSAGSMVILVADLLSLALIKSPGEMGADIAVGSTQRFGVPMAFGGPHAGYFATKEKFSRKMPGRLVGVSQDKTGLKAYRLALQTREQHIRREKATSNICTAQALLAIMAGFYGVWHGPNGLKNIAMKVNQYASKFANLALRQVLI